MTVVFAEGKNVVLIVKDNIGEKSRIRRLYVLPLRNARSGCILEVS